MANQWEGMINNIQPSIMLNTEKTGPFKDGGYLKKSQFAL